MSAPSPEPLLVDLAIRSYGATSSDRHDFAQLVLPLSGEVLIDIEGRAGRLDPLHGAFVAPSAWHAQSGAHGNRSLIVDIGRGAMAHEAFARLSGQPFTPLGAGARKLVEYMGIMHERQPVHTSLLQGWIPLLLDTLVFDTPQPRSRLAALLAQVQAQPGLAWSTESMANAARMSVSRLHALFRQELDTSPHAWLLQQRIEAACRELAGSTRPIAEVALRAGFSDQSALNRALRRHRDTTPAAVRRDAGPRA
ncbi:MAG: AraC family transcriptional regulator [Pseudomonadota bacterium]